MYHPRFFDRFRVNSALDGDDFSVIPLTETIDLCGTVVAPPSTPAAATHAISLVGGGLTPDDKGPVARSVAVYRSTSQARTPYDAIAHALATCDLEVSKAVGGGAYLIEPLTVEGALAWRRDETGVSGPTPPGTITLREVWTATVDGGALLVQHEPISVTASRAAATSTATALLEHAARLRSDLAEKTG